MMDTYCVIQFKDKEEKKQILMMLMDTNAEYKVTTDLKKFVAEKFRVTILEKDQLPNALPQDWPDMTFDNLSDPTPSMFSTPSRDRVPSIDSIVNPFVNNGTYDPYRNRMKQEVDEDNPRNLAAPVKAENQPWIDVEMEGEDDHMDDDGSDDDDIIFEQVVLATQKNAPTSSSSGPSSGSIGPIKRVKTNTPASKQAAKKKWQTKLSCKKCGASVVDFYSKKVNHAIVHTDIKRYECMVLDCGFQIGNNSTLYTHMNTKHPDETKNFREIELTQEQKKTLVNEYKKCFKGSESVQDTGSEETCQICEEKVKDFDNIKRMHSLNHVSFMLYQCMELGCAYESKTFKSMNLHNRKHGNADNFKKLDLSSEQKKEIDEVFAECFPAL